MSYKVPQPRNGLWKFAPDTRWKKWDFQRKPLAVSSWLHKSLFVTFFVDRPDEVFILTALLTGHKDSPNLEEVTMFTEDFGLPESDWGKVRDAKRVRVALYEWVEEQWRSVPIPQGDT